MSSNIAPDVSVVVPVYNDRERLARCLAALEQQTYPADRYEVIVVDNGSQESIADVVQQFPHASWILEARPGSFVARNTGIKSAHGEIMAFTDSDCTPDREWLTRGVEQLLSKPNVGLVAGRIDLYFRNPAAPVATELYEKLFFFRQEENIRRQSFASTSSLFTHRRTFECVGLFDDDLKSAGDVEWGQRVAAAGFELMYADDVIITHPTRSSLAALRSRRRRDAGGAIDLWDWQRQTLEQPKRTVWGADLFREFVRIAGDPMLHGITQRISVLRIALVLRAVVLTEMIRLRCGRESLRE